VRLSPGVTPPIGRGFAISSACGVCGADSIAVVHQRARWHVATDPTSVTADVLIRLPDALREQQATFRRTGGLHAAGLFTTDGSTVVVREDVGRHNAVDKVVGFALREGLLPLRGHVLQVSGRSSMELVYKSILAGVPILSAVSAPSSMAVDLARAEGLTLAGFVRGENFTLYSRADRVR
jgi:formate dehydrogenase accessory protein FdhD